MAEEAYGTKKGIQEHVQGFKRGLEKPVTFVIGVEGH